MIAWEVHHYILVSNAVVSRSGAVFISWSFSDERSQSPNSAPRLVGKKEGAEVFSDISRKAETELSSRDKFFFRDLLESEMRRIEEIDNLIDGGEIHFRDLFEHYLNQ